MCSRDFWYRIVLSKDSFRGMHTDDLGIAMRVLKDCNAFCINVMRYHDRTVYGSIFDRGDCVCYIGDATILKWIDPCWHYIDCVLEHIACEPEIDFDDDLPFEGVF